MNISKWRLHYWSCSSFANWIRGTRKLGSGTSSEWSEWERSSKKAHPLRHWLAEQGLNKLQDFIHFPSDVVHSVRAYVRNRWRDQTHALRAHPNDIPRGQWRDFGDRILPCLFNELVVFVEEDMGLERLQESCKVPPEEWSGVVEARETLVLYWWWKHDRPLRKPADERSVEFYDFLREKYPDAGMFELSEHMSVGEQKQRQKLWEIESEIKGRYEQEDTAMLTRLILIRHCLWS